MSTSPSSPTGHLPWATDPAAEPRRTIADLETPIPERAVTTLSALKHVKTARFGHLKLQQKGTSVLGFVKSLLGLSSCVIVVTRQRYYLFKDWSDESAPCLVSVSLVDALIRQMDESFTFCVLEAGLPADRQWDVTAPSVTEYRAWINALQQGSRAHLEQRRQYVLRYVVLVQKNVRRHQQRKRFLCAVSYVTLCQSNVRTNQARRAYLLSRRRVILVQSLARRWIAQRVFMQMRLRSNISKFHAHRTNVVKELRDTEASYIADLDTVIKVFLKPLRSFFPAEAPPAVVHNPSRLAFSPPTSPAAASPSPTVSRKDKSALKEKDAVTADDIAAIFSTIEDIRAKHGPVLAAFDDVLKGWNETTTVSQILLEMTAWIPECYVPYCNNYENATHVLEYCKRNEKFMKVIDAGSGLKAAKKLDLFSFLIMPVQRVPRYILLLKDLLKRTWPEHPDYAGLTLAIAELSRVAKQLNEAKRRDENRRKMAALKQRFATTTALSDVVADDVACLHEGPVEVRVGDGPSVKSYLLLFSDSLIISKRTTERGLDPKSRSFVKTYRFSDAAVLQLTDVSSVTKSPTDVSAFNLVAAGKPYRFCAKTQAEADEWVKELKTVHSP